MCLVVDGAQPRDTNVGVKLSGGEAGVAQQFLHDPQVGAAFEEMGGGAVAQTVRPDVGRVGHRGHGLVHHGARLARIQPTPTRTQQQGRSGLRRHQGGSAVTQPGVQLRARGLTERDGALLVALTEHPQ